MAKRRASVRGKGVDIFFEKRAPVRQKATFYFPPGVLEELDDVWMELRRRNRRIKKSDIVVAALEMVLEEYAERKEESTLFKRLIP